MTITKNIIKASKQARSNLETNYALDKQLLNIVYDQEFNDTLKDIGEFPATILQIKSSFRYHESAGKLLLTPSSPQTSNFYEVYVRPKFGSATPDPVSLGDVSFSNNVITFGSLSQAAVEQHQIARSRTPVNLLQTVHLQIGDIVLCEIGNNGFYEFDLNSAGKDEEYLKKIGGDAALEAYKRGVTGQNPGLLGTPPGANIGSPPAFGGKYTQEEITYNAQNKNIMFQYAIDLPPAPNSTNIGYYAVQQIGQVELDFWDGKKEDVPEAKPRLKLYWDNIGTKSWTPSGTPWSAAFISYVLKDSGFPGSSNHGSYTRKISKGKGQGWKAYSLVKNVKAPVVIGDVLVKNRNDPKTGEGAPPGVKNESGKEPYKMTHGDVVYKIENSKAYLIGGNVGNTAKVVKVMDLNQDASLKSLGPYLVILKKES